MSEPGAVASGSCACLKRVARRSGIQGSVVIKHRLVSRFVITRGSETATRVIKCNSKLFMTDFLSQLNEQQREAVTSSDGPLLILAGAGSGKTRVIAHRIAYLIAERGVWPRNILAVTFTNKAAEEMRNRVTKLIEGLEIGSAPFISTFHSLCVRILRRDIETLNAGYTRSFTIYDQDDTVRLTRNAIRDLGMDDKQLAPRSVQSAISAAKNRGEDAEAFAAKAQFVDERRASIARVFQVYEERLHQNNALDFDDLLIKTVRLLRDVPEVRERYNERFRYLLVDEYQDTNQLQFGLIRLLTEKQQKHLCRRRPGSVDLIAGGAPTSRTF